MAVAANVETAQVPLVVADQIKADRHELLLVVKGLPNVELVALNDTPSGRIEAEVLPSRTHASGEPAVLESGVAIKLQAFVS